MTKRKEDEMLFLKPTIPSFDSWNDLWKWCHERCMFAELLNMGTSEETTMLNDDDIANSLIAYHERQQIIPIGPYTDWVNKWLE